MALLRSKYFLPGLAFLFCIACIIVDFNGTNTLTELSERASKTISLKEKELSACINSNEDLNPRLAEDLYKQKGIGYYVYQNGILKEWNNSQIPVPTVYDKMLDKPLVVLRNGYYLTSINKSGKTTKVALTLIKARYDLQNKYLKNKFADWLGLKNIDFKLAPVIGSEVTLNGKYMFSIKGDEENYKAPQSVIISTYLFLLSLLTYLLYLLWQIKKSPFKIVNILQLAAVILLRCLMLWKKWPAFLYQSELYNLRIFGNAQSFLNGYLGDIILNAILYLWLVMVCYYYTKQVKEKNKNGTFPVLQILFLSLGILFHNHLFNTLIANSTVSFDFLNLFHLTWQTFVSLIPIALVNIGILVCLYSIYSTIKGGVSKKAGIYFLGIVFALTVVWFLGKHTFAIEKWWIVPFSIIAFFVFAFKFSKNILAIGALLFSASLISSAVLNKHIDFNQQKDFELLSFQLTERQDAILENEFVEVSNKMEGDVQLKNMAQFISFNGDKEFLQLLKQNYFFGYFDRYNIEFSMFDEKCLPILSNLQPALTNQGYFEEQINYQSVSTISENLFFIDKYKKNSRYIAQIKLGNNKLFILFEPKYFEEVGTFPDLLLDESQQSQEKYRNNSYAVYRDGVNNSMYGEYNYPISLKDSMRLSELENEYAHYFYYPDENSTIVISSLKKDSLFYFTYNSYLFLFFAAIAYLTYLIYGFFFSETRMVSSFTRRIQTTVILLLLISIAAVGITSTQLISNQFNRDNEKELQEKAKTILSELSGTLQNSDTISDVSKELIDLSIKKFAYVFNSEVSIFDNTGKLYVTSQPRLYDLGLAAPLLNPEAFYLLKNDLKSNYCSKDKAGNLNYQSHYAPIYNSSKKLLAFLNLPYFGKQSVLVNELSKIISTLLNVYVILFIVSILSGLILAGYITLPLRILKQQLSKVSLGSKNEAIKWESDDEVGKLVSEYNLMIEKLDKSAGLLAKSERETAWREMAKQVAHEIKNPLTPMKLNLQYLQHVIKNNPTDFEERFSKASNSIIEQIDTLANIATEFSNFAKLPSGEAEKINLVEVLKSTAELFEKENKFKISLDLFSHEAIIMANKEQMLRVFNNLLTNAIQATSEMESAHIQINLKEENSKVLVEIKDNGCGIPEELKQKIFTPNFTTKSTGSGLGLAMVKNILENSNAKIWFESTANKGTTFYLEFEKV